MLSPHIIRLRGPWEFQPLARTVLRADGSTQSETGDLPPAGRMQMPADWSLTLGADFRGRVRYSRGFNWTTELEDDERVELVVEPPDAFADVTLNDSRLGHIRIGDPPARFPITTVLQPRNELVITVELPRLAADSPPLARPGREGLPGGLIGEVRLEIF